MAVAGLSAATIQLAEQPFTLPIARGVEQRGWGLLKQVHLPSWAENFLALVLMDYTLYVWHVLTHRVPLLWRFHQVHHVDLDMDASTALRFHFGEMILSIPWRCAQIITIGVSPRALSLWQTATILEIMFHHSNVELPYQVERRLSTLLVTPRMHGIHHSTVEDETNSNWSSGLTIWDWLHGTLKLNVPQDAIEIGVAGYRDEDELHLPELLKMPFEKQRSAWQLPGDGHPVRSHLPGRPTELEP